MDPATATLVASAIKGGVDYLGNKSSARIEKKKVKESKRKTFADLLNEAMNRRHDTTKSLRGSQNEFAGARAKSMQDLAAGIRQSLLK